MSQYAKDTSVSCEMSRLEIERVLIRYGAQNFAYAMMPGAALIGFSMHGRTVKFVLPLPKLEDFSLTPTGRARTEKSQHDAWEQACRQRWRALKLVIQAKLEAVECGISVFEDEFMANIVVAGGKTVSEYIRPQITDAYERGTVPQLIPQLTAGVEILP